MQLKQLDYSSILSANKAKATANGAKLGIDVAKSDARYTKEQNVLAGISGAVNAVSSFKTIIDETNSAKFSQAQTEYSLMAQKVMNDLADAGNLYNEDWSLTDDAKKAIEGIKANIDTSTSLSGLNASNKQRLKESVQNQFNSTYQNRVQAQTKAQELLNSARSNASSVLLNQAINVGVNKFRTAYDQGRFANGYDDFDVSEFVDLEEYLGTVDGWSEMSQEEKLSVVQSELDRTKGTFFYNAMLSIVDKDGMSGATDFISHLSSNGYISADEAGKYRAQAYTRYQQNVEQGKVMIQDAFNASMQNEPDAVVDAVGTTKAIVEGLPDSVKAEVKEYADSMVLSAYLASDEYTKFTQMLPSEMYEYYENLDNNEWFVSLSESGQQTIRDDLKSKLIEGYDSVDAGIASFVEDKFKAWEPSIQAGKYSVSYVYDFIEGQIYGTDFTETAKQSQVYQQAINSGLSEEEALQAATDAAGVILTNTLKSEYERLYATCSDDAKKILTDVMDNTWGTISSGLDSATKKEIDAYIWQYAIDWIYDNGNSNQSATELRRNVQTLQDAITGSCLKAANKQEKKSMDDVYKDSPDKEALQDMQRQYSIINRYSDNAGLFIDKNGDVVTIDGDVDVALKTYTQNVVQLIQDNIIGHEVDNNAMHVSYSQDFGRGKFAVILNDGESSYAVMPDGNGVFTVLRATGSGNWESLGDLDKKGNVKKQNQEKYSTEMAQSAQQATSYTEFKKHFKKVNDDVLAGAYFGDNGKNISTIVKSILDEYDGKLHDMESITMRNLLIDKGVDARLAKDFTNVFDVGGSNSDSATLDIEKLERVFGFQF